jgi:hypothetical protein
MKNSLTTGILITVILLTSCTQSPAESPAPTTLPETQPTEKTSKPELLKVVGQIGGPTQTVALQGDYAYVGVGLRLIVLDITNPSSPKEIGATEPFGWYVEDMAVAGNAAFVAAGGAGLYIVDISNPTYPTMIGGYDTPGYAEGVTIAGNYAYIADGPAGLRVLDVTDRPHPVEVATAYTLSYAFDIAVEGGYAYIAAAGAGLLVAELSDPAKPKEVGSLDTAGYAYSLTVSGNTIYVADGWGGLRVVDISNPSHPLEVSSLKTSGWSFDVVVRDSTAYVADGWGGVRLVDVTNPMMLVEAGNYQPANSLATALTVAGKLIYVADRGMGLRVLDVSGEAHPVQVALYSPVGYAADVAVAGNHAYVAAGRYGLRMIDISDLARPREVGSETTQGGVETVAVVGQYVYGTTFPQGGSPFGNMYAVDVSNPAHSKTLVSHVIEPGVARDMVIKDGIAYITDEWGLQLIDVSNPSKFTRLSSIDLHTGPPGTPATIGIDVSRDMAYVAQSEGGLLVVDVSDPRKPVLAATYTSPDIVKPMYVAVSGDLLYLGDHGRLHVMDISDPRKPRSTGFIEVSGFIDGMALMKDRLYLAISGQGVEIIDISSPESPVSLGSRFLPGNVRGLTAMGKHVYAAAEDGGLYILEETANAVPARGTTSASGRSDISPFRVQPVAMSSVRITPAGYMADFHRQLTYVSDSSIMSLPPSYRQIVKAPDMLQASINKQASGESWTVTSTADSGTGTLRWALENAHSGDTIFFDPTVFPPYSPATIRLTSALPVLSQGNMTIDASDAGVILDGSSTTGGTSGLHLKSDGNSVKGLQITGFSGSGVLIDDCRDNLIGGDSTVGHAPLGEGNLISGNDQGVNIIGEDAAGNIVSGNYIGTDITGRDVRASRNVVGGMSPGQRNIISGNGWAGVALTGEGTSGNRVVGNYIGLDASGAHTLGHVEAGVRITFGASGNIIGGETPAERNVVSGNGRVEIGLQQTSSNRVVGNYIGTDSTGSVNLGNTLWAVGMESGAFNNTIERNVISTNGINVVISDWGSWGNEVIGNFIGVDATGTKSLGGTGDGIHVNASFNKIGGTMPGERNMISGNGGNGIKIGWRSTSDVVVIGNYIGTDVSGTRALGNSQNGIRLTEGTRHSFVGGASQAERNVIAANQRYGVYLGGLGVRYNFIIGNYVGVGADNTATLANHSGIVIESAAHNFVQVNLVAYNSAYGVVVHSGNSNHIHHNSLVNNPNNASDHGSHNSWDDGSEGNYWSDYKGKDVNGDRIGEIPYQVPPNALDNYPLMEPYPR